MSHLKLISRSLFLEIEQKRVTKALEKKKFEVKLKEYSRFLKSFSSYHTVEVNPHLFNDLICLLNKTTKPLGCLGTKKVLTVTTWEEYYLAFARAWTASKTRHPGPVARLNSFRFVPLPSPRSDLPEPTLTRR